MVHQYGLKLPHGNPRGCLRHPKTRVPNLQILYQDRRQQRIVLTWKSDASSKIKHVGSESSRVNPSGDLDTV